MCQIAGFIAPLSKCWQSAHGGLVEGGGYLADFIWRVTQ